jgi:hypothetical protein
MDKQKKLTIYAFLVISTSVLLIYIFHTSTFYWKMRLLIQPVVETNLSAQNLSDRTGIFSENISHMTEVAFFLSQFEDTKKIVSLSQDSESGDLLSIDGDGNLLRWDTSTGQSTSLYKFPFATSGSSNFSLDGKRVIAGELQVWEVPTGKLIYCFFSDCSTESSESSNGGYLAPQGDILVVPGSVITINDFDNNITTVFKYSDCSSSQIGVDRADNPPATVITTAIDPTETYFAYVLENGVVCVRSFPEVFLHNPIDGKELSVSELDSLKVDGIPRRLRFVLSESVMDSKLVSFDPSLKWLAILTDSKLTVWSLNHYFLPLQISESVEGGNAFSFDRTGNLLALGAANKLIIFNVAENEKIAEFAFEQQITAIYFTTDNQLVLGDANGNLHIWGAQ